MTRYANRPRPLRTVAQKVSAIAAVIGGAVSSAATIGAISMDQHDAVQGVLAGVAGLATAVTAALAAFGVVRQGEPKVTPLDDPRNAAGVSLVPGGRR
ncbi:hypothetical protein [Actinokineospora sp. UTMC 2448]|uniref:hypothetical protein n=1 Tax=Actinokineospora sp. UTMC 2448 TaxID=2268449 RepID=UPI002164A7E0|nr:hypothetical protein [Actinokineospora sp. UTMC 2448]UVS81856.1 hypothetical protein Actkin_05620 [Actinokineospora sp. UTMC 2448]